MKRDQLENQITHIPICRPSPDVTGPLQSRRMNKLSRFTSHNKPLLTPVKTALFLAITALVSASVMPAANAAVDDEISKMRTKPGAAKIDAPSALPDVLPQKSPEIPKDNLIRLADNGFFDPYSTSVPTRHKAKKYKAPKKKNPDYSLGASKGYIKSYYGAQDDYYADERMERYRARRSHSYGSGSKFRTMCVRVKDGYYWPINFAQRKSRLKRDAVKCQKSCADEVRLFVYRTKGGDIDDMRDLKGRRYADMENAYLYRTKYVKDASCKPKPWSAQAQAKHAKFAAADTEKMRKLHIKKTKRAEKKRLRVMASNEKAAKRKARRIAAKTKKRVKQRRYAKKRNRATKSQRYANRRKSKYSNKYSAAY